MLLVRGVGVMTEEVGVGAGQALLQGDGWLPAQGVQAAAVHELARGAVGLGGVEVDLAGVADHAWPRFGPAAAMVMSLPKPTLMWLCMGLVCWS